jgi:hypothetical protein
MAASASEIGRQGCALSASFTNAFEQFAEMIEGSLLVRLPDKGVFRHSWLLFGYGFLDADISDIVSLMPQPFKRRPDQTVTVDPGSILQRPALGVLIAHVSAHWSILEQSLTLSFATILSGQEPSALVNYNALFDINLRHSQFLATAKSKGLPQTLIEESEQLHARIRKTSTRRNKGDTRYLGRLS